MSDLRGKIDLNAPAFGAGAQKLDELSKDTSVEETHVQTNNVVEDDVDSVEETQVPYSRFKKFHNEARQARLEADEWRAKAEQLERGQNRSVVDESIEMPSYWKELYGDSEASQKAWTIQERREQEIVERAYEAGQRGAEELETKQAIRIENNVATIDDNFADLEEIVGHELTAKEQSAVLDIVDDFTPKDEYGRYAGPLIPFERAWEMYELKQGSAKTTQRQDRDSVASLSSTSSQGDTSVNEEQSKNWNPLARGTWRNRL